MVDETRFPNGFDDPAQGVVQHTITKWRSADQAALGFVELKIVVAAGLVGLRLKPKPER